jgi:adenosylmethionine-8-amino-7-oxononanoate aminotransferase
MNLIERDAKVIWHPFTPQKNRSNPIPITLGKGTLLFDADGKSYIDAISSWWVNIHGHAHPYIAEKLYQQALTLEHVIFAGFTHEPAVQLAERLLKILPGNFSRIFYSDNGSTSTEVALKMAIQYWWNEQQFHRKKIIAFNNAYHGDTFGAMSVSDRSVFTLAFHDLLFEVIFIDTPTNENIKNSLSIIEQHSNEVASFIYEPLVQGSGGLNMYDAHFLERLIAIAKKNQIICIADEVMTGFYRTGKNFASEYVSLQPDIICLSKALTGATMALGVTACTDRIYNAYVQDDALKTFFHGHSFTANPLPCSAALASLDLLLQPNTVAKVEWLVPQIKNFSQQLMLLKAPIKNIRVLGTILAFEITSGKDEYLNNISEIITQSALQQGIDLRPLGNTVYIMPPYCITEAELNKVFEVIKNIVLQHE